MSEFLINGVLQASYKYDAMGRQAIRALTSPTPVTIHSVFDIQGRRIAEYNEATGALIREYVWNSWDPVAVIEGGTIYYVRADHIGRPVFATNSTGVKVWSATYTPFGGVHTSTGSLPTARFPGQWFQSESGLHQNWMRDYDPTTGRYLQADPLGLVDGASVYGYVKQSPMRFTDPTGQFIPAVWACLTNPVCASAVITAGYLIYDLLCAETTEDYVNALINAAFSMGNPCKGPLRMICTAPFRGGKGGGGAGSGGGGGKGSNHLKPDPNASGDHSTYRQNQNGETTAYETWTENSKNPSGYDSAVRVDTQYSGGASHYNKATGKYVPVPHVHDPTVPGGVRPANPGELPP
jgi:RHS repeat-associated protein